MMCFFVIIGIIIDLCPKLKQQHSFVHSFIHSSALFFQLASHHFLKLCRWPMALKHLLLIALASQHTGASCRNESLHRPYSPEPVFLSLVAKPLAPTWTRIDASSYLSAAWMQAGWSVLFCLQQVN